MFAFINLCLIRNNFDLACLCGFVIVVENEEFMVVIILCVFSICFCMDACCINFLFFSMPCSVFNVALGCNHHLNKNYVCEL